MEKYQVKIILLLFLFLSSSLALVQKLPEIFYFQDPIDPNNLTERFDTNALAIYDQKEFPAPSTQGLIDTQVLGDTTSSDPDSSKKIEVDLTNQHLYAYENGQKVFDFVISSGKYDRTPTGTFTIWTKIRSQKMSGGSKEAGTYYYLPNVPYIMFFYNDQVAKKIGYSLHGTYWHNNFGVPMSHGCINMKTPEVAQLYNWAEVGTTVTIYGKYQTKLPQASAKVPSNKL
jgi:lipoprotein-anchoring transpeptidase ErfK/SrfK